MVMMGDKVRCQVKMPGRAFGVLVLDFLYTLCPGASPKLLSNDLSRSTLLSMICLMRGVSAALATRLRPARMLLRQ